MIHLKFLILSLAVLSAHLHADQLVVGMVDFPKIQRHYYRTAMEQKAIAERGESEAKKLEETITGGRAKAEELLKAQQAAQQQLQDPTLSDEKKQEVLTAAQKRAVEISEMQRQVQQQQVVARNQILQQAGEANAALLDEINDAIRQVAEQKSIDFVMNRSFGLRGIPTFPYASAKNVIDLTDEVIGKLNQNAPADWSPHVDVKK